MSEEGPAFEAPVVGEGVKEPGVGAEPSLPGEQGPHGPSDGATASARRRALAGVVGTAVVATTLAMGFDVALVDATLLGILLAALPALALAQVPLAAEVPLQRIPTYLGSIGFLTLLGFASWLVGTRSGGAASIGLVALPPLTLTAWTAGLVLVGMGVIYLFRALEARLGTVESVVLRELLPRNGSERGVFAVLSAAAGLGEELAYRGYAVSALAPIVGVGPAAAVTSVAFGVLHGYQGSLGMSRASVIGGVFAFGFIASGSLWPPIIAHAAIDVLAGIVLGERLLIQPER